MKHSRVRGRSRRRARRPQVAGAVIRSLAFLFLLAASVLGVQWARDGFHRSGIAGILDNSSSGPSLTVLAGLPEPQIQSRNQRLVYPYSVVPGGVRSAAELRDATAHDPVVAKHYAGFDFERARVTEVVQPQLVYLSYRRGQQIYWTRKQASLNIGEKLITDGHITARSRCGNQVSTLPHTETSPEEPTMAELDRPDALASGIEQPSALSSDLLHVDPILPLGPSTPGGGGFPAGPGVNVPPPIGGGGGGVTPPPGGGNCPPKSTAKNCQHAPPPPPPPGPPPPPSPPPAPEPSTLVLAISGAAAIFARLRWSGK